MEPLSVSVCVCMSCKNVVCVSVHQKGLCVDVHVCVGVIQQQLRRVGRVGAPAHLISSLQGSLAILHHRAENNVRVLDHQPLHRLLVHLQNKHTQGNTMMIK